MSSAVLGVAVSARVRARVVCRRRARPTAARSSPTAKSERRGNRILGGSPNARGSGIPRNANPLRSFDPEEATIPGLIPLDQICDDFVCKSSPAVESSLRQIATDICAIREDKRSVNPFAVDVKYDDGERKFEGREGFTNHTYIKDNVDDARAAVTEMRMGDLDAATIEQLVPGRAVHRGPVLTVPGTLLQDRTLLHFYRRIWKCVGLEMEGTFYLRHVVQSMHRGSVPHDVDFRFLYYTSDLPLDHASNLSARLRAVEGIPPLYATTREVLRGILTTG